jgi:deoxyribonuclease V
MQIHPLHRWDLSQAEAVALQRELAGRVRTDVPLADGTLLAGADASYNKLSPTVYAGVVVLRLPDLAVVERRGASVDVAFPYVPGLLSFREAPALLAAFARVESKPDAVMCDGQGLAHPRRIGIACHLGLWLDTPCFGCGKTRLVGRFAEPGRAAGSRSPLTDRGEVIGEVVRTKNNVNPVFVSPGHKIDLPSAIRLTLESAAGYRIPEPTRQAHLYVNELRRGESAL